MNIIDPILFQCRVGGTNPALCLPGLQNEVVTYSQLGLMIENLTAALRGFSLKPGQVVGIGIDDKIFHFVLTLALIRLGVTTACCRERGLPPELQAEAIFVDKPGPVMNAKQTYLVSRELLTAKSFATKAEQRGDTALSETSVCRLVLTSGTTGTPKAVPFSHSQVIKRIGRFQHTFAGRFSQCTRIFCDMGVSTSLGFLVPIFCLMRGGLVYLYGDDGMASLQGLSLYRVQNMITSPYNLGHYADFLEEHPSFSVDLNNVVIAGSTAPNELIDRVWSRVSPRFISAYGATEVGVIASSDVRDTRQSAGAVGFVHPGARVEIVDEGGALLANDAEGIIRIKTDEMATGYRGDPVASAAKFRQGWFYPGDIGRLTSDRLLVVSGREDLLINIGGDKMKPELLEEKLSGYPGITEVAVAAKTESSGRVQLQAFIVTKGNIDQKRMMNYWRSKLQEGFVPTSTVFVSNIPRNEMGKIDRARLLTLIQ